MIFILWPNSAQAQGVSRNWVGGGATDDWFDTANWSPAANPDDADFLSIGSNDVAGLNTNDVDISDGGRITIGGINAVVTLDDLGIGVQGEGTLAMALGTLMTGNVRIGQVESAFGSANISGPDTLWNITRNTFSDLIVGNLGEGRLNITNDAEVNVADDGFIGGVSSAVVFSSGTGVVDISGFESTLSFTGANSDLFIGNSGNGTLNIANRAAVSNDNSIISNSFNSVGKVTIDSRGTWTNTGSMTIANLGTGTLEIRGGGSATSTSTGIIGDTRFGIGRVLVDGIGSLWDLASTLKVGDQGTGQLEITDGGGVENSSSAIGNVVGSRGSVIVRGSGSGWQNNGLLDVGNAGIGTLLITDGGAVGNTGANIGNGVDSTGTVTVEGIGSTWFNTSSLGVGVSGDGTLNIAGSATVMNFVSTIANDSGSTGTVNVSGGGTNWNNSGTLTVGLSGVGTLNITGGAVVSSTSGFVSSFGTSVGSAAVVDGVGSRWEMTTGGVEVGSSSGSSGLLTITNGGSVTNAADMTIANLAGSNGAVNVFDAGSLVTVNGNLLVGNAGTASMSISVGGAAMVSGTTTIGSSGALNINDGSLTTTSLDNSSGGTFTFLGGTVTIDGGAFDPGSNFSLNGTTSTSTLNLQGAGSSSFDTLTVGNTGEAVLNITDGYQLTLANTTIGASGEVVLNGGTLTTEGFTNNVGTFTFLSGTLALTGDVLENTGGLTVPSGGTLSGWGTVDAEVNGLAGSTITANGGSFMLGDSTSFLGFVHAGTLNVAAETVNLQSAGFAQLGPLTTLAGGTLNATGGVVLGIGDNLTGNGAVSARVAAGFGSTISASGNLTLGDSTSPIGFSSDGVLSVGSNTVTIDDSNAADLGILTTLGTGPGLGGTLDVANGALIDFADNISGNGTIQSPNDPTRPIINNGSIVGLSLADPITLAGYVEGVGSCDNCNITGTDAPGFSPASVNRGSVSYNGTLEIEIGGLNPGSEFDQLNHILSAGLADLGGILDVQFINGFTPSAGDTFEIITAASVAGTFDTLNLPALFGDLLWFINYGATSVELVSTYGADFDEDGDVDNVDLAAWEGGFGSTSAMHMDGDANADTAATGFDFLIWQRQFGNGGGAPLASATTIPEPSSLLLAALGLLTLTALRKRA